jgi:hypothetical protein
MCQIAGKDVKNLRYVVSAEILNTDTEKLIIHSLQSTWKTDWRDEECKNWEWKNRVEWSSDSEQFKGKWPYAVNIPRSPHYSC